MDLRYVKGENNSCSIIFPSVLTIIRYAKIRKDEFFHYLNDYEQSELGRMFEALADIADDDTALAEMQDLGLFLGISQ